ncbi:MAG: heavy metal translocating P-type ATPase [Gammaproteobacteria bacterium]|nr:heavy metal translocating P-type ATPase [Gammaproteobacteria bacterium]
MSQSQCHTTAIFAPAIKCGNCLNSATSLLHQQDPKANIEADLEGKKFVINSWLDADQVLAALAKYQPVLWQGQVYSKPEATVAVEIDPEPESAAIETPHLQMTLQGMTCAACVNAVTKALSKVPGVDRVEVNFASRQAAIYGSAAAGSLQQALRQAGYDGELITDPAQALADQQQQLQADYRQRSQYAIIGLLMGAGLMLFGMDLQGTLWQRPVGWATLIVMLTTGSHFYSSGFKALRGGRANMDTLIAMGTLSAWLYSITVSYVPELFPVAARAVYFEAAVMIVALVNLGQALELRARRKTQASLNSLLDLRPSEARLVRDDAEVDVPVMQVQVGDLLRLRPGDRVAVDGEVITGSSNLDESMLTGEPMPVVKQAGDQLAAGTINQQGSLLYRATRIGQQTALARIIELVRQAQNSKPAISRLADQVAAVFVPVVMLIALLTAIAWYYLGPAPAITHALVSAVSVLIIACPCALGLATPISVMLGVGKAAQMGVLVRNADALQVASKVDWVLLDKTGTLTQGKPSVVDFICFHSASAELVKSQAKAMEQASEHPLANAIVAYCAEVPAAQISDFKAQQGLGLTAADWALGNQRLMQQQGINMEVANNWLQDQSGHTVVFLAQGSELQAAFAVADPVRSDSAAAVARLQKAGAKVMMLTGDNSETASKVAAELSIDQYQAGLMPADKLQVLQALQAKGHKVAMVGDGINDAPALSQADVGFAIGSGTDVAMESADMCLLRDSLHGVADAIALSHATLNNIRQNLWGAFAYNTLGIPIAAGLLYPLTGMLLSPVVAGLAMSLSSVTVVTNANRLRFFKPDQH